ncbi:toxin-antitoxin system YwqK family antitoxin [Roseivirga pacifica]|uniref:toxin-antitoxin system YwqK family antitoxin n=1 Tax=Roseivirga pacifica TaxID=1267423 RepID=UPI00227B2462|nr:toxin-antitoxin system YwqK family antitoxin [Roseivirga pacifica]
MKGFLILLLLAFTVGLNAQNTADFTQTVSGYGNANGGYYEYEAKLKFNIQKVGLGDIRFKVGIIDFKITSFKYDYKDAEEFIGVSFPITVKSIGSGFSARVFASRNNRQHSNFNVNLNRITSGALDIYDLEGDELKTFNNAFDLMVSSENIKEVEVSLDNVKLTNEYFDELSSIRALMDKKTKTAERIESIKEEIEELEQDEYTNNNSKLLELYTELSEIDTDTDYSDQLQALKEAVPNSNHSIKTPTGLKLNKQGQSQGASTFDAIERGEKNRIRMQQMELSAEERRRVSQMTAHLNTIDRYESYGMSRSDAQRFANYESNMHIQEEIITQTFQSVGNIIIDGIGRRQEAINANEDYIRRYKQSVEATSDKLRKYASGYHHNLDEEFEAKYGDIDDIDQLKKAILEYIFAWDDFTYAIRQNSADPYSNADHLLVLQNIERAYFDKDELNVIYSQEVFRSTRDKDDEYIGYNKRNTVLHYSPALYSHTGWFRMDTEDYEKTFYESSTWQTPSGLQGLPTDGYMNKSEYRRQLSTLSGKEYYKPKEPGYFGAFMGVGNNWAIGQTRKLQKLIEREKINSIDKDELTVSISNKLDQFLNLKPNTPYLFKRKENISGSDKEVSVFAFNNDDYIIYTIPDPSLVKQLFKDEVTITSPSVVNSENRLVKHKTRNRGKEEGWFVQGNTYSNVYFGNNDLLWIGEQYVEFSDDIYYVLSKSRNGVIAELELKKEQTKDYLNPYLEVGKIQRLVDYNSVKDTNLNRRLKNSGFEDKTGLPLFQLKLNRTNLSMLFPQKKADFVLSDDGAKDDDSKQKYLYFEMTNYTTHYGSLEYDLNEWINTADFYNNKVDLNDELEELSPGQYNMSQIIKSVVGSFKEVSSTRTQYYTSSNYRTVYEIIPEILSSIENRSLNNILNINDGLSRTYHEHNGSIQSKGKLVDYKKEETWEYYHPNGQLSGKEFYEGGRLEGQQKLYYSNGQVKSVINYTNNLKTGRATEYFENGQEKTIGEYVNGTREGGFVTYYPNGKQNEKGNFKKNKPNGTWTKYYPNGQINQIKIWENGLLMEVTATYGINGSLLEEKTVVAGNGTRNYYNERGELIKSENYVNGKKVN